MSQLTLIAPPVEQVKLTAKLIADRVSIKPGQLWQITAGNGGSKWQFPIQFTELEARLLLPYLQARDWWEFDDRGVPIQIRRIHAVIESMVDGRGGISAAIAAKLAHNNPRQNKAKQGSFPWVFPTATELMIGGVK